MVYGYPPAIVTKSGIPSPLLHWNNAFLSCQVQLIVLLVTCIQHYGPVKKMVSVGYQYFLLFY